MNLQGQIALVSGGSRGIGEAVAYRLAQEGAKVAVNYNAGASDAQRVVERIVSSGGEAVALKADVFR